MGIFYRSITIYYTILVEFTVLCMILSSFVTDFANRKLAYRAWLPFNCSVPNYYYVAYAHQIVALIGTSLLNVACDVVVCGLFVHVCSQLEILKHRLRGIVSEMKPSIGKIVRFHDYLYGLVSFLSRLLSFFHERSPETQVARVSREQTDTLLRCKGRLRR